MRGLHPSVPHSGFAPPQGYHSSQPAVVPGSSYVPPGTAAPSPGGFAVAGHRRTGSGGAAGYSQPGAPQATPMSTMTPTAPTCARGHLLGHFATDSEGWSCNDCGQRQAHGALMFGCRTCNYDKCVPCTQQVAPGAVAAAMQSWGTAGALTSQAPSRHTSLDSQVSGRQFSGQFPTDLGTAGTGFGAAPRPAGAATGAPLFPFHVSPGPPQSNLMGNMALGLSSPSYAPNAGPFHFTAQPSPLGSAGSLDGIPEGVDLNNKKASATAPDRMLPPPAELAGASPYPGGPAHIRMDNPASAPTPAKRPDWRSALCERAFSFVDPEGTGQLNVNQNKTGLTMVMNWLGDVPMPKDSWFVKVFRNFAESDDGFIDLSNFKEIVIQWDEHHLKKKKKKEQEEAFVHTFAGISHSTRTLAAEAQRLAEHQRRHPSGDSDKSERNIPAGGPPQPQHDGRVTSLAQVPGPPPQPPPRAGPVSTLAPASAISHSGVPTNAALQDPALRPPSSFVGPEEVQPTALTEPGTSAEDEDLEEVVERPPSPPQSNYTHARTRSEPEPPTPAPGGAGTGGTRQPPRRGPSGISETSKLSTRISAAEIDPEVMFPTYVGRLAIFDDYEFFGDVGVGAFGKVMVVRHRATKQLRACKVACVKEMQMRELIDTEIKLLRSLNHPNIMKMHEVYFEQTPEQKVTNGNIYIVTELLEGGDLSMRIDHHYTKLKQPMTESHVAYMMQQILSATNYCHGLKIIHRDIKPENILFVDRASSSPLKIIDFGLANFTDAIERSAKEVKVPKQGWTGKIARMLPTVGGKHLIPHHDRKRVMQRAGTPHYMAPEMIEGCYDQMADLFSIGIVLCQLLTGWHPFYVVGVDDEASVRAKIASPEPVQFPSDKWCHVSPEASDLAKQLLEKSPEKRISAARALAHAWFRDPAKPSAFGNHEVLTHSTFDGLMQYQAYNKLKRAVLQLLTRELSEYQVQDLRQRFMALDAQGDGLLSPEELAEGMRHVGYNMSPDELSKVVASLDTSGKHRIGYKEFISALIERRVKFDRTQLWECFKKFDFNDTGKISYEDVKTVVGGTITESEWQDIVIHLPGHGQKRYELNFDEFVTLMESG